ncbi:MAG TPA: sugar phosphate nucleotidyltransferase [Thermoanaerobaculia bacterium]|nr:sugar phosphate nucleotidyltransferase [Thermoanaerobaculia bacterium]
MKAMILAAGYGTRFRPATYTIPKPMVPVCNRPLIAYAVDALVAAGIRQLVVNLHHLPEPIEAYLRSTYIGVCDFEFSFEPEILGTGGGVRKARPFFPQGESFLLVNGDTIQFPPFAELEAARKQRKAVAALLLRHPPAGDRFTEVFFDDGLVTGFGSGAGEALMFSGSHSIGPEIFDLLPDRDFSGITEDAYLPLLKARSGRIAGVVHDGPWFDIGTPSRYMGATESILALIVNGTLRAPSGTNVLREQASLIAVDTKSAGSLRASCIGFGSVLERGTSVSGSAVWNDVNVGRDSAIRDSIICSDVTLPPETICENVLCCNDEGGREYPEGAVRAEGLIGVPIDASRPVRLTVAGL